MFTVLRVAIDDYSACRIVYKVLVCSLLWIGSGYQALAQADSTLVGDCPRSIGEAYLDVGNVRARILNNGALFYRGEPHVYEVPKGSGANAIFSATIWIGGLIDDELVVSASRYGEWEFWPGPLDETGRPPTDCSMYDRLWEIRKEDVENYIDSEEISQNLIEWPWYLGAPVIDGDGNLDNYDLEAGDLPELLGDQRIWWVMNDRGNIHTSTNSSPIGIEVHGSAFSFANAGPLGNQTFYNFKLINRRNQPVTNTYFGIYVDVDLGDFADDYVGSDTTLGLGYIYNADNFDEGAEGYGEAPPAIGMTFLHTPEALVDLKDNDRDGQVDEPGEQLDMIAAVHFFGDGGALGDPQTGTDYYNYLQGLWAYGDPITEGGVGFNEEGRQVRFHYPGDPLVPTFWSELNTDGNGTANDDNDQRILISSGPFQLLPETAEEIAFAIIWSRGENHLDSVRQLKAHTKAVRDDAALWLTPTAFVHPIQESDNIVLGFDQNFPNPFSTSTTFRYSLPRAMQVKLSVYDVLGREISVLVDELQRPGIHTADYFANSLPAGVYMVHVKLDHVQFVKRMVRVR